MRGLPQDQAEKRLTESLQAHGVWISPVTVQLLASHMSRPAWGIFHPVKARRWIRDRYRERMDDEAELAVESESTRLCQAIEGLDLLRQNVTYWSVEGNKTALGMRYVVAIRPWSEEVAEAIRVAARPLAEVDVVSAPEPGD